MSTWKCSARCLGVGVLAALTACSPAGPEAMVSVADAGTGADAGRRADFAVAPAHHSSGTSASASYEDDLPIIGGWGVTAATVMPMPGDTLLPDLGMGSDAVDMDQSGPMIHPPGPGGGEMSRGVDSESVEGRSPRPVTDADDRRFEDARFTRPEHIRGLYVNAWAAGSTKRMEALIDLARRTEINAFVIDIKDATGYISHRTSVPLAHEIGATEERRIGDLPGLLDRLEEAGIYPIARIVVVKDPILAKFRPELAIQDTAGGIWIDSKEIVWMNPFEEGLWAYNVAIAREVTEMGFPEIQWDYIRFPDAPESDYARAVFPGGDGRSRSDAIRGFLAYAKKDLSDLPVRSTADVFGVTTSFRRDIGLGQLWESFIDVVDVALPMVYPSHYWEGSFGYSDPNAYPYEIVRAALRDALRRSEKVSGAGLTRPWIQDFTLGPPAYGAPEVRAQIQAAYDVGIHEWILWNPSTRYSEGALEPVEGFQEEPLVRVAGLLTPVSRRHLVIDSVAALSSLTDSVDEVESLDSAAVHADTVRSSADIPATPPDTTGTAPRIRPRR
ncbi:MAG: putative glycoside hydrolase [Gemmatimonadetes bacterium]|nr:putative glycoside hydrolase [Gemmatimonadota bacterium]NNF13335.1 putative glycoside hydrolase [Gemmatimonadota bacterium]